MPNLLSAFPASLITGKSVSEPIMIPTTAALLSTFAPPPPVIPKVPRLLRNLHGDSCQNFNSVAAPNLSAFEDPAKPTALSAQLLLQPHPNFVHARAGIARNCNFEQPLPDANSLPFGERLEVDSASRDVFLHCPRTHSESLHVICVHEHNR